MSTRFASSPLILGSGMLAAVLFGSAVSGWTEARHSTEFYQRAQTVSTNIEQRLSDYQTQLLNQRSPAGPIHWKYPEPLYATLPYPPAEYWRNLPALLDPARSGLSMSIDVYGPEQAKRVARAEPVAHFELGKGDKSMPSMGYDYLFADNRPVHVQLGAAAPGMIAWLGQAVTLSLLMILVALERRYQSARQHLLQSQRRLERNANRLATVEMGAAIVHELNQPLTGLLASLEAWSLRSSRGAAGKDTGAAELGFALNCARQAAATIAEIRSIVQRGEDQAGEQSVAVPEVIRRVVQLTAVDEGFQGIDIAMNIIEPMAPARGRAVGLAAILMNLLRNSAEAIKLGGCGGTIGIDARMLAEGLAITLTDDGPGFADPDQLFQPFYTTKPQGLGLGIRFCRRTIEHYGGSLQAGSTTAGGAEIRIVLRTDPGPP